MAENTNTDQISTLSNPAASETPDSGHDPQIFTTSACQDLKKEDPDTPREPKRRKNCPRALDNIHESANFNFTFDTKFINGCTSQFTPKFGFFNLLVSVEEKVKEGTEQQEEEEEGEVREGREVVSSLRTVDGVKGVE